jgi:hypothetical protein
MMRRQHSVRSGVRIQIKDDYVALCSIDQTKNVPLIPGRLDLELSPQGGGEQWLKRAVFREQAYPNHRNRSHFLSRRRAEWRGYTSNREDVLV